jgi:integrase
MLAPATVRREMGLLSAVLTVARREWGWLHRDVMADVRKPPTTRPRTRRISWREVRRILRALGYTPGKVETRSDEVAVAFLVALRTAMRSGEILSMERSAVRGRVAYLELTKNGDDRAVPLSRHAMRALAPLMSRRGRLFAVSDGTRDALFRRAVDAAGIEGLHFHDTKLLLKVLHQLRDAGNTIVVIEHNLDVIKTADWVIDMGPEGGAGGGRVVVAGTPEDVAAHEGSHTGRFLKALL